MIRILTCLLFLTFAAAARAEPPLCQGEDLFARLKAENPQGHAAVLAEAAAIPNGEAVFWRVKGKDEAADSWLFGTAHVTDPRVLDMPKSALAALDKADIVALELKEIGSPQLMALEAAKNARFMAMPPGESMWALIPDNDEKIIFDSSQFDRSRHAVFDAYQPWVLALEISIPACERRRQEAQLLVLDDMIAQRAASNGAEVLGLETVAEQLGIFSAMPLDLQVKYAMSAARAGDLVVDLTETTISLYRQRKVTSLMPLLNHIYPPEDKADVEIMAFIESNVVEKRNAVMRDRALALLARGNAFIAVGALHLPGKTGLVSLLRQAGFEVTAVD